MEASYQKTGYLTSDFQLFSIQDQRKKTFDLHYHDFHKILIFLQGNISYAVEGRQYDLQPGDILLFGSSVYNIWHAALYIGGGNFIHAPYSGAVVSIQSLSSTAGMRLVAARRIV